MAQYITRIHTSDGDKQIDYNALANLPDLSHIGSGGSGVGGGNEELVGTLEDDGTLNFSLINDDDIKAIAPQVIEYAVGVSGTVPPEEGWSESIPEVGAGKFLWSRGVTTFGNGQTYTTYGVSRQGKDGRDGSGSSDGTGANNVAVSEEEPDNEDVLFWIDTSEEDDEGGLPIEQGGTGANNAEDARQALQVVGIADALSLEEIAASTDLTGKVASASAVKNSIMPKRFYMQGSDRFAIDYDQSFYITEKAVALMFSGHFTATGDGNYYCLFPTGVNAISGTIFAAASGGRWTVNNIRYCYVSTTGLITAPITTVGDYLHISAVIRLQ